AWSCPWAHMVVACSSLAAFSGASNAEGRSLIGHGLKSDQRIPDSGLEAPPPALLRGLPGRIALVTPGLLGSFQLGVRDALEFGFLFGGDGGKAFGLALGGRGDLRLAGGLSSEFRLLHLPGGLALGHANHSRFVDFGALGKLVGEAGILGCS